MSLVLNNRALTFCLVGVFYLSGSMLFIRKPGCTDIEAVLFANGQRILYACLGLYFILHWLSYNKKAVRFGTFMALSVLFLFMKT